jgi:hypothetical protein
MLIAECLFSKITRQYTLPLVVNAELYHLFAFMSIEISLETRLFEEGGLGWIKSYAHWVVERTAPGRVLRCGAWPRADGSSRLP